jgi:hypothetical protein
VHLAPAILGEGIGRKVAHEGVVESQALHRARTLHQKGDNRAAAGFPR